MSLETSAMKTCPYCGAQYPDDAKMCATDHTSFDPPAKLPAPQPQEPQESQPTEYEFIPMSEAEEKMDLVSLMRCTTLVEADVAASRLRAAGIDAFIPDESLMQLTGWNLNAYGYVRVQVSPKDYNAAKELLSAE
jgi:hypothetical protein